MLLLSNHYEAPHDARRRSTHAPGTSRMRRAWNHALSQARARRRRRWASVFFWRLRLWTLAGTFPVPYKNVRARTKTTRRGEVKNVRRNGSATIHPCSRWLHGTRKWYSRAAATSPLYTAGLQLLVARRRRQPSFRPLCTRRGTRPR
jgi:hypothetical protein